MNSSAKSSSDVPSPQFPAGAVLGHMGVEWASRKEASQFIDAVGLVLADPELGDVVKAAVEQASPHVRLAWRNLAYFVAPKLDISRLIDGEPTAPLGFAARDGETEVAIGAHLFKYYLWPDVAGRFGEAPDSLARCVARAEGDAALLLPLVPRELVELDDRLATYYDELAHRIGPRHSRRPEPNVLDMYHGLEPDF